jgi:hypothetical protein
MGNPLDALDLLYDVQFNRGIAPIVIPCNIDVPALLQGTLILGLYAFTNGYPCNKRGEKGDERKDNDATPDGISYKASEGIQKKSLVLAENGGEFSVWQITSMNERILGHGHFRGSSASNRGID